MEFIGLLIFLFVVLVICGPYIYTRVVESRRRRDVEDIKESLASVSARFDQLQKQLRELEKRSTGATAPVIAAAPGKTEPVPEAAKVPPAAILPHPVVSPVAPPPRAEVRPVVPAAPPPTPQPVAPAVVTPAPPRPSPERPLITPASAQLKATPPVASYRPPAIQTVTQTPAVPSRKFSATLEEMIGTNWLPKLGVTIMFIGLVSWIASQWEMIPPAGRIALFYLLGAGMLSLGVWLEKKERYLVLGRALIGGGWAVTFFTTYAMHHVAAAKILASIELDLLLMIAVAAAMVWHTLKYESQAVTGLAFLLGFFSVTQSHESVYSLLAGVILAVGLTVIVLRRKWYELEIFGILATFLNHFYWLYPIIAPMQRLQGHNVPFAEYSISIAVLLAYWTIFRTSYVIRKIDNDYQEKVSTIAGLLNSFLLLGVMKYQSLHKELAFFALLVLGAIELTLAHLPILKRRRTAFLILSTLGGCLLIGAVPFRYADQPTSMSVLWLIFAQAFFFSGVFGKEVLYRRFGMLTAMLVGGYEMFTQGAPLMTNVLEGGVRRNDLNLGLLFAVTGAVFYINALWAWKQWPSLFVDEFDQTSLSTLAYMGGLGILLATYALVPQAWVAVTFAAFACGFAFISERFDITELMVQSHLFGLIAILDVIINNGKLHSPVRLITFLIVAALLYASSRFARLQSWGGTFVLTFLIYEEFAEKSWIAPSLMLLALMLTVAARYWKRRELLWQSHGLALLAFFQVLAFNFTEPYRITHVQLISVTAVIATFYAIYKLGDIEGLIESARIPQLYCWAGSLLVTWLMWYQLPSISVAIAWAMFGVLMFELGINDESSSFRMQGYVALAASFVLIFFANLNHPGRPGEISPRVYTVLPLALIYFYIYWRVNSKSDKELDRDAQLKVQSVLAYLGTITIAALIRFEAPSDWVIAGWAALVFGLLLVALRTRQSLFLHQALLLLIPISFRAAMANFYNSPDGRILTVGTTALILLCSLPLAFVLRNREKDRNSADSSNILDLLASRPEQMLFFVPVALVTVLLVLDMPKGMLTLSWGAEGIIIFALALLAGERSFRLTGLALLMLSVAKILLFDVWNMNEPRNRYLTLIGMGAILLLVSFLYGKYREKVRELL